MKSKLIAAASTVALIAVAAPATAQMNMPGMTMPMPSKHAAKKKTAVKKASNKKAAKEPTKTKRSRAHSSRTGAAHPGHAHSASSSPPMAGMAMPMNQGAMQTPSKSSPRAPMKMDQTQQGKMSMPMPGQSPAASPQSQSMSQPMGHPQADHGQRGQMKMPMGGHAGHGMAMNGALGPYPMERESSGTAWQPDSSEHSGLMTMSGDWTLMAHGVVNLVYDHQSGPRGDNKAFASGMLMGMASHPLGNGTAQFKAMLSPDPIMGPRGYPLLLATGEIANGRDPLIDRQHPHDFFMELSGSLSQNVGSKSSLFLYGGLPGEPAFGPPAFMHRESIMDSPEAPITHHWLDSTHISFGVLTAGLVVDRLKVEVSRFNGREPDQHRWNIETGPLDSTSVRISWNPTRTLALQGSWGHFTDPEQLEPGVDQKRWSASALWANDLAPGWHAAATLAWGRKSSLGHHDDGFAAEASMRHAQWTLFGRAEMIENRELLGLDVESPAYRVGKASLGAIHDFPIAKHFSIGAGGLLAVNFVPDSLAALYGGHDPIGTMGFVRLKLN